MNNNQEDTSNYERIKEDYLAILSLVNQLKFAVSKEQKGQLDNYEKMREVEAH